MTIPERYLKKDAWPHTFTKKSSEYMGDNGRKWQDMVCTHCYLEFIQGRDSRPLGACPARADKSEYKRILG